MTRCALRCGSPQRIGLVMLSLLLLSPRSSLAEPPLEGEGGTTLPRGWKLEQRIRGALDQGVEAEVLVLASEAADSEGDHPRMLLVLQDAPGGARVQIGGSKDLLLCVECFGALGGGPEVSIERSVLIVRQERGSRETVGGTWRFRRDKQSGKMRLIGLDVQRRDRATGVGSSESTNYLTGARIDETLAYDPATDKVVVTQSRKSSVNPAKRTLEDVTSSELD